MQYKTKKWRLSLCLASIAFVQLFAQGIPSDTTFYLHAPKTVLQHSIALNSGIGGQYDIRFRTPNKTTDFYAAINCTLPMNFSTVGVQGGVLIGNWHNFSLGAGAIAIFGTGDSKTISGEYFAKNKVILGIPLGIRYQPPYRSVFVQANYVPMLSLTDGTSADYPQIQVGYSFGGRNPNIKRDTTPIPKGIQHSAYAQFATFGWGLAYDARFRTKIKWLDWAATATAGFFPKINSVRSGLGTSLGASALFGKRSFSFELGVQGVLSHFEEQELSYLDYKTGDYLLRDIVYDQNSVEMLLGLRYQRPKGGISGFVNMGIGPSYNSRYPTFQNFGGTFRAGIGYSLKTK